MRETTKAHYRRMAQSFYKKHFPQGDMTPTKIVAKLADIAPQYRPDSWRNLRNAVRMDQAEQGYRKAAAAVGAVQNPTTVGGGKSKHKQQRCRSVSHETTTALLRRLAAKEDKRMWAAVSVAYLTGCRPAEMPYVRQLAPHKFAVQGAKKTEDGNRGLDRIIVIKDDADARQLREAVKILAGCGKQMKQKQVQNNIATAVKAILPKYSQRYKRPTLYSWRHQFGSDLKASGLSRIEVAYLMGHQSTKSVEVYGSRRSGSRSAIGVEPGINVLKMTQLIRQNHKPMPHQRQELAPAPKPPEPPSH